MPAADHTATVVFADLVGSTGLFEALGDQTASRFVTQLTTALSQVFAQHRGRVVKTLGDGLFVVFEHGADALSACMAIQQRLRDRPIAPAGLGHPVQMQMGVDSGDVVEIDGDFYGDAVNCAARLADLAGARQIFATERVVAGLPSVQKNYLKNLGPMYLRGKAQTMEVYSLTWDSQQGSEATVMGVSIAGEPAAHSLRLRRVSAATPDSAGSHSWQLEASGSSLRMGRGQDCDVAAEDSRVSRLHAQIQWRSGYFVLEDMSSYGTWVYLGTQSHAIVLRRTECYLVGSGSICLGCERDAEAAVVLAFEVAT